MLVGKRMYVGWSAGGPELVTYRTVGGRLLFTSSRTWSADRAANSTSSGAESAVEWLSGCELALER